MLARVSSSLRLKSAMAATSSSFARPQTLPSFLNQSKFDLHAKFVDLEWQQRNRLLQGTQPSDSPSPWSRLSGEGVTPRNRYMNVEPFAQNRVKLRVEDGENDYINASPIQLGKRKYIATQGPQESGITHFYRMLAAEVKSPAVVVMLTQTHEAGKEKCFQYYPLSEQESPLVIPTDEEAQDEFGGEVVLENVEDDETTRTQIRTMRLRTSANGGPSGETEIKHLLFSGWPDFLVPEGDDRTALIELVRLSASLNRASTQPADTASEQANGSAKDLAATEAEQDNPRIIHCSAGVGRSGTFIALDYLLAALHDNELDDLAPDRDPIAETVDRLRQQRMMMVQGESQFHFLYDVMREQFLARMQARDSS